MPLTLVTGTPGAGKTLYTLSTVSKLSDDTQRQVYYHNIKELKYDWVQIDDPQKWTDLPDGSILVLDECQDTFPVLKMGAVIPDHYALLAKHRHSGKDIYLITQHPQGIHNYVRNLVDEHVHVVRKSTGFSTLYFWESGYGDIKKLWTCKSKKVWGYPKSVFDKYKSAEVHTITRKISKKGFVLLPLSVIALVGLIYGLIHVMTNMLEVGTESIAAVASPIEDTEKAFKSFTEPTRITDNIISKKYAVNTFNHGVLDEQRVHLVGSINGHALFDVEGHIVTEESLTRLGYSVVLVSECVAKLGNSFAFCPPDPASTFVEEREEGRRAEAPAPGARVPSPSSDHSFDTAIVSFTESDLKSNPLTQIHLGAYPEHKRLDSL